MLATNPFEDDTSDYLVIVNQAGQHSLWPAFREVPAGWTVIVQNAQRGDCLDWIAKHWKDMRPQALIARMKSASGPPEQGNNGSDTPSTVKEC